MFKIDRDFVYNKFPKTEHDVQLYEKYKDYLATKYNTEGNTKPSDLFSLFPVYEGTENAGDLFVLTRFGFMALSIDDNFMNTYYKPWCRTLLQHDCLHRGRFSGSNNTVLWWRRRSLRSEASRQTTADSDSRRSRASAAAG